MLDNSYAIVGVVSGNGDLMYIPNNEIFVGSDPLLLNGLIGCVYGMKLDNRDLPVSGMNEYFIATPSEGGAVQSCSKPKNNFLQVFDSLYILGGVALGFLILLAIVCVIINKSSHYCYTKRRDKLNIQSCRDPIFSPVNPIAINRTSFNLSTSYRGVDHSFLKQTNSFEQLSVIETGNIITQPIDNMVRSWTIGLPNQTQVHTDHPQPNDNKVEHSRIRLPSQTRIPVQITHHTQQSDEETTIDLSQTEDPVKPTLSYQVRGNRFRQSTKPLPDSVPVPPNIKTKSTNRTSVSLDPKTGMPVCAESEQDFDKIRSYIMGRVKDVNKELLDDNYDQMKMFSEEGPYIPLGSIGSLYDIVQEEEEEVRIFKMECQSKAGMKYDQRSPSPLISSYSLSPTKNQKHKTHILSVGQRVSPKILRKAISSSRRRPVDTEKQLLMRQLMREGSSNPLAEINYDTSQV